MSIWVRIHRNVTLWLCPASTRFNTSLTIGRWTCLKVQQKVLRAEREFEHTMITLLRQDKLRTVQWKMFDKVNKDDFSIVDNLATNKPTEQRCFSINCRWSRGAYLVFFNSSIDMLKPILTGLFFHGGRIAVEWLIEALKYLFSIKCYWGRQELIVIASRTKQFSRRRIKSFRLYCCKINWKKSMTVIKKPFCWLEL